MLATSHIWLFELNKIKTDTDSQIENRFVVAKRKGAEGGNWGRMAWGLGVS